MTTALTIFATWFIIGFVYLAIDLYKSQQRGMDITVREIAWMFPGSIFGPVMLIEDIMNKVPELWNLTLVKSKDTRKKASN